MTVPLAEQLRPQKLEEIVGQEHLLGPEGAITHLIKHKRPLSLLLYGPPGCGKTTLARLYAQAFGGVYRGISAVSTGAADLKALIEEIKRQPLLYQRTFLFIDELHRYNKAQQDLLLPDLEKGTFILIGATTENPSFTMNNALLSRLRVLVLRSLSENALNDVIRRYEQTFSPLPLDPEARQFLVNSAQGDGRYLLNMIEHLHLLPRETPYTEEELRQLLQQRAALGDRQGEFHYNLISALHKSVRGSDPDAALYWFCRMLEAGQEPLFIARRLIRMASEDIGLADPNALSFAVHAHQAYHTLGSPEGELALAQVVIYLALAPKSNALYTAYGKARKDAVSTSSLEPPKVILNAPTALMKEWGFGKDYQYDHDTPLGFSGQDYFPDTMERVSYYHPVERGNERLMKKRLDYFSLLRKNLQKELPFN